MADNSQRALNELLKTLHKLNAKAIAAEITQVVSRGVTEEKEIKGRVKELSQRPFDSEEAYRVGVEMLIATLEAAVMTDYALCEIERVTGLKSSITWFQDFVENSPLAPENYEDVSILDSGQAKALEADLKNLVALLGGV